MLTESKLQEALESLIDGNSLSAVLSALETVCGEKAEHVRCNWQDEPLALAWDDAGKRIGKALSMIGAEI